MIVFVSWLGSKVVGLLRLVVREHWHLFFSQSMKFWVSSGSISSRKKLSFSRRSLRWSKPRSHRLQQEKCRPLRFSIWAQLTATSIEVPLTGLRVGIWKQFSVRIVEAGGLAVKRVDGFFKRASRRMGKAGWCLKREDKRMTRASGCVKRMGKRMNRMGGWS